MGNASTFKPNYAIPPSETLIEVLANKKITLSRLSKMTGLGYETLIGVMESEVLIDELIADKLEEALEIPATFWLNLEVNYRSTLKLLEKLGRGEA